ncbi:MAG: glycosyltransferase [Promethearchaeota archaeon]
MVILLELVVIFIAIISIIYISYFILVLRTRKKKKYIEKLNMIVESSINVEELPNVTILIPTYNEEETIYAKIRNTSEFNYPRDKIEVFVLDDNSMDKTWEIAETAFEDFGLNGRVIRNETRKGVNTSYNRAVAQANSGYILTTDADAIIPPDSLVKAVKVLMNSKDIGGVAATMIPVHNRTTGTTRMAIAYANSYNSMLVAESAIFSTFPGSTSCMLMRKSAFSPISTSYGSSDGNISLSIIQNGFKFILAPCIVYYEPISQRLLEQRRQKIRRATRLIQSTLLNLDILFTRKYKEFGRIIFPLRLLMTTLCPILTLSSIFLFFAFAYFASTFLFIILLAFQLSAQPKENIFFIGY